MSKKHHVEPPEGAVSILVTENPTGIFTWVVTDENGDVLLDGDGVNHKSIRTAMASAKAEVGDDLQTAVLSR